jgi:hypothetical protein
MSDEKDKLKAELVELHNKLISTITKTEYDKIFDKLLKATGKLGLASSDSLPPPVSTEDAEDKEAADKEAADKEKAAKEAADKEAEDKEKAAKEAADKEAADKEAADKEKAAKEAEDKEKAAKAEADKEGSNKINLGKLLEDFTKIIHSFNYNIEIKKKIALHLCSDLIYNKCELLTPYEFILLYHEFKKKIEDLNNYYVEHPELGKIIQLFKDNDEYKKIKVAVELFNQTNFNDTTTTKVELDYKTNYYNKVYGVEYQDKSNNEPRFYNKLKENVLKLIEELVKAEPDETSGPNATTSVNPLLKILFELHTFINETFKSNKFKVADFEKLIENLNNEKLNALIKSIYNPTDPANTFEYLLSEKINAMNTPDKSNMQENKDTNLNNKKAKIKNYFDKLISIRIELDNLIDKEESEISSKLNLTLHANKLKNDVKDPLEIEVATELSTKYERELDDLLKKTWKEKIKTKSKPVEVKAGETKAGETKAGETKPDETKPDETGMTEPKAGESKTSKDPKIQIFIDLKNELLKESSTTSASTTTSSPSTSSTSTSSPTQISSFIENKEYKNLLKDSNNKFIFDLYSSILENILTEVLNNETITDKITNIIDKYTKAIEENIPNIKEVLYLIPEEVQNNIIALTYDMLLHVFNISETSEPVKPVPGPAPPVPGSAPPISEPSGPAPPVPAPSGLSNLSESEKSSNLRLLKISKIRTEIENIKREYNESIRAFNTSKVNDDTKLNPILFNIMYLQSLFNLLDTLLIPSSDITSLPPIKKPDNPTDIPDVIKEHLKADIKSGKATRNLNNEFPDEDHKKKYIQMKKDEIFQNILQEIKATLKSGDTPNINTERNLLIQKMEEIKSFPSFFSKMEQSAAATIVTEYTKIKEKSNPIRDDIDLLEFYLYLFIDIKLHLQYS